MSLKVRVKPLSLVPLLTTPWTLARQTPPSVEFSRQEYWSGLPFGYHVLNSSISVCPNLCDVEPATLLGAAYAQATCFRQGTWAVAPACFDLLTDCHLKNSIFLSQAPFCFVVKVLENTSLGFRSFPAPLSSPPPQVSGGL